MILLFICSHFIKNSHYLQYIHAISLTNKKKKRKLNILVLLSNKKNVKFKKIYFYSSWKTKINFPLRTASKGKTNEAVNSIMTFTALVKSLRLFASLCQLVICLIVLFIKFTKIHQMYGTVNTLNTTYQGIKTT